MEENSLWTWIRDTRKNCKTKHREKSVLVFVIIITCYHNYGYYCYNFSNNNYMCSSIDKYIYIYSWHRKWPINCSNYDHFWQ